MIKPESFLYRIEAIHRSSIPISIYAKLFAEAIVFSIDEIVGKRQRKEWILDRQCGVTFDNKKIDRLCR